MRVFCSSAPVLADDLVVDAHHGDMVMWIDMVSTIYILQVLLPHIAVDPKNAR